MMASIGKWLGEFALSWLYNWISAEFKVRKRINDAKKKVDKSTDRVVEIAKEIKDSGGKPTAEQKRKLIDAAKFSRINR